MGRGKNKLTAAALKAKPVGMVQDGGGLMLDKTAEGGKWIYRYSIAGRRRDMGLGAYPEISLAAARAERDKWAAVLQSGLDPVTERQRRLEAEKEAMADKGISLEDLIAIAFEAKKASLRGDGERGRWMSPLKTHVIPKLGKRQAAKITQVDLRDCLAPIWKTKPETCRKILNRLSITFKQGRLANLGTDPFTIDAARHLLGDVHHESVPIASTPWQEIPALYAKLGANPTTSHLCLQFIILTAVRGDAARGARLDEIDGDVWTVPKDRMKGTLRAASDFRVPLSPAALEVVQICTTRAVDGILFPGEKRGGVIAPISVNATINALNDLGEPGRPHGFRTSFRTWVQDHQAASYDVAETALGHIIGSKVERSYARSDLLDQRRILMGKWAEFVTGKVAKVVEFKRG
jgi:integrase